MSRVPPTPTKRGLSATLALLLVFPAACSDSTDDPGAADVQPVVGEAFSDVPQDAASRAFIANVVLTDEGFEPDTLFLPAGRQVRLVLRNRGEREHHYRVVGLVPTELRWRLEPDLDDYELESSPEFDDVYADDVEHVLHHLTPSYVAFKEESPSGVKPIGNEVHGYAASGKIDVVTFYALRPGTYDVIDALNPDLSGTVIVFDPQPATS